MKDRREPVSVEAPWLFPIWGAIAILTGVVAVFLVAITHAFGDWRTRAEFGDTFGALGGLAAALSLMSVIYGIYLERKARHEDEEIKSHELLISASMSLAEALKGSYISHIEPYEREALIQAARFHYYEMSELLIKRRRITVQISAEDVQHAFKSIDSFSASDEKNRDWNRVRVRLLYHRISSVEDLRALVNEKSIINPLQEMYQRKFECSLDPEGLAVWGGLLYQFRNDKEKLKEEIGKVESRLNGS